MRQKVSKERIQGGYHPLGHPPLLPELGRNNSSKTPGGRVALPPGRGRGRSALQPGLTGEKRRANCWRTTCKESSARRPSPRGRFAAWATRPRDSASRESSHQNSSAPFAKLVLGRAHRRAMRASRPAQPRSTHCRLAEAGGPSPPPATGPQHSLRSFAPAQATDRKTAPPTVFDRAPGEIIPDKLTVYRRDFLLRRGARVPLGTRKLELARQLATTALRGRRPN